MTSNSFTDITLRYTFWNLQISGASNVNEENGMSIFPLSDNGKRKELWARLLIVGHVCDTTMCKVITEVLTLFSLIPWL